MLSAGIDPTEVTTKAVRGLGEVASNTTSAGTKTYIYVQASGAITGDGFVCDIDGSAFTAVMATTTTGAPGTGMGKAVGVARAAIASLSYGWLQVYGAGLIRNSASCVMYTLINTTATAGQLDDDATVGARVIDGIVLDVTTGGAAALTAGSINWPRIGRTL